MSALRVVISLLLLAMCFTAHSQVTLHLDPIIDDPDSIPQQDSVTVVQDSLTLVTPDGEQKAEHKSRIRRWRDRVQQHLNEPFDTVRDSQYWKRALSHGKLNLNDRSVKYPKFLNALVNVYRWANHALNYYDPAYVAGTGKKGKITIKYNNWLDSHSGFLYDDDNLFQMNSNLTCNFGAQVSFMGLSLGYTFHVSDLINGDALTSNQWDFSFTTSRFVIELYLNDNDRSNVRLHRLCKFKGDYEFYGLSRETHGLYAYYFFNNTHYAHSAAYGFSKYQLRSAGSFIAGIHLNHQDIKMDFTVAEPKIQSYVPGDTMVYRFLYQDYCVMAGYAYNWVVNDHWLLNITALPSIGYRQSLATSIEGRRALLSTNIRAKAAAVLNRGNYFYGLHIVNDSHWYHSRRFSLFSSNIDFILSAGYRF